MVGKCWKTTKAKPWNAQTLIYFFSSQLCFGHTKTAGSQLEGGISLMLAHSGN